MVEKRIRTESNLGLSALNGASPTPAVTRDVARVTLLPRSPNLGHYPVFESRGRTWRCGTHVHGASRATQALYREGRPIPKRFRGRRGEFAQRNRGVCMRRFDRVQRTIHLRRAAVAPRGSRWLTNGHRSTSTSAADTSRRPSRRTRSSRCSPALSRRACRSTRPARPTPWVRVPVRRHRNAT
jgi:hypothetical protein